MFLSFSQTPEIFPRTEIQQCQNYHDVNGINLQETEPFTGKPVL
jgi:hypothetical protein